MRIRPHQDVERNEVLLWPWIKKMFPRLQICHGGQGKDLATIRGLAVGNIDVQQGQHVASIAPIHHLPLPGLVMVYPMTPHHQHESLV